MSNIFQDIWKKIKKHPVLAGGVVILGAVAGAFIGGPLGAVVGAGLGATGDAGVAAIVVIHEKGKIKSETLSINKELKAIYTEENKVLERLEELKKHVFELISECPDVINMTVTLRKQLLEKIQALSTTKVKESIVEELKEQKDTNSTAIILRVLHRETIEELDKIVQQKSSRAGQNKDFEEIQERIIKFKQNFHQSVRARYDQKVKPHLKELSQTQLDSELALLKQTGLKPS